MAELIYNEVEEGKKELEVLRLSKLPDVQEKVRFFEQTFKLKEEVTPLLKKMGKQLKQEEKKEGKCFKAFMFGPRVAWWAANKWFDLTVRWPFQTAVSGVRMAKRIAVEMPLETATYILGMEPAELVKRVGSKLVF